MLTEVESPVKYVNTDLGELCDDKPSHPVCGRCKKPKVRRSLWLVELELS
jgi:hypothetical protein